MLAQEIIDPVKKKAVCRYFLAEARNSQREDADVLYVDGQGGMVLRRGKIRMDRYWNGQTVVTVER